MLRVYTDDWGFRYVWDDELSDVEFVVVSDRDVSLFTLAQRLTQRFFPQVMQRHLAQIPRWEIEDDVLVMSYEFDYPITRMYPLYERYNFLAWYDWQILAFFDMLQTVAQNHQQTPLAKFLKKYGLSIEQFALLCKASERTIREAYALKKALSAKRTAKLLRDFEKEMRKVFRKQNELVRIRRRLGI